MANLNDALKMHIGNLIIRIAELEVEVENLKDQLVVRDKLIDSIGQTESK